MDAGTGGQERRRGPAGRVTPAAGARWSLSVRTFGRHGQRVGDDYPSLRPFASTSMTLARPRCETDLPYAKPEILPPPSSHEPRSPQAQCFRSSLCRSAVTPQELRGQGKHGTFVADMSRFYLDFHRVRGGGREARGATARIRVDWACCWLPSGVLGPAQPSAALRCAAGRE